MAGKRITIKGDIERLEEIIREAGICLKSPEDKALSPRQAPPDPKSEASEKTPKADDAIDFVAAMEGVKRLSWNRSKSALPKPVPPAGEDPELQQARLMQEALEDDAPIPLTDHPEYIEGWVGISGKRFLPGLRNGLYSIQGQIDLHGMNLPEARAAVEAYIVRTSRLRPCCIKIIHGRGINSPGDRAVLKDSLPKLLATRKMSRYVVAYASSAQCDGGVGSMYVLIRPRIE